MKHNVRRSDHLILNLCLWTIAPTGKHPFIHWKKLKNFIPNEIHTVHHSWAINEYCFCIVSFGKCGSAMHKWNTIARIYSYWFGNMCALKIIRCMANVMLNTKHGQLIFWILANWFLLRNFYYHFIGVRISNNNNLTICCHRKRWLKPSNIYIWVIAI